MKRRILALAAALLLPVPSFAQTVPAPAAAPAAAQPGRAGGGGFGGATVVSPEIAPDGRVTFRLRAPQANAVSVTGLPAPLAMTKDDQGLWSATTPNPLTPDIYVYTFVVDGVRIPDPGNISNPLLGTPSKAASAVLIPGVAWTAADVPHGAVSRHIYKSPIIGADETYMVYTPPGYDSKRREPYPIVVLLHGLGDQAQDWIAQGGANLSLDSLIAQGKAVPMILVTPAGYGNANGTRGAANGFPDFTQALITEIMPQVEREYNAATDANHHAISGLSMGAAQSPLMLNHVDQFAWIGEFSPGFDMYARINTSTTPGGPGAGGPGAGAARGGVRAPSAAGGAAAPGAPGAPNPAAPAGGVRMRAALADDVLPPLFPNVNASANAKIKLLWLSCGTDDDHLMLQRQFKDFLEARGVKITVYQEVPGYAHVWPFWRMQFAEFAQRLFK